MYPEIKRAERRHNARVYFCMVLFLWNMGLAIAFVSGVHLGQGIAVQACVQAMVGWLILAMVD